MAREALLSMNLSSYSKDIVSVIELFYKIGWAYKNNQMEYLPLHDNEMFNWQSEILSYEKLHSIISKKQQIGELIGVNLYYGISDIGITLLAKNTEMVTLSLNINRKTIAGDHTDISWYITKIAAPMERCGCKIEHIDYQEYIG